MKVLARHTDVFGGQPTEPRRRLNLPLRHSFVGLCLFLAAVTAVSCGPQPIPCDVMTLDQREAFDVLSRYGRSYFDTDCLSEVPKEVLVKGEGYGVYILLRANTPAQAFIGIRPHGSSRFELRGLPNQNLRFQVTDRETGKTRSHSFKVGTVRCTCKTYDGP